MAVPTTEKSEQTDDERAKHLQWGDRILEWAETLVYIGIAAFLVITALSLLVQAGRSVIPLFGPDGGSGDLAINILDLLLLVFIVVELLFAVRITIARRELIAEPFLLVGIIASIKEIVVLSVKAADEVGKGPTFTDSVWEIGVLGVLVVVFGGTAWLLRRKEREPTEGAENRAESSEAAAKPSELTPSGAS
jgi:uncharacterized membrane protein (DUF373 family)